MGSMLAGMAFANSGLGLVHGLVHPLGARVGVSHGELCGRLLPLVMRFNLPAAQEKLADVAQALTGRTGARAEEAPAAVEALLKQVDVPAGLADLDIPEEEMPGLAKDGLLAGAVRTNPRKVSEEESYALLEEGAARVDGCNNQPSLPVDDGDGLDVIVPRSRGVAQLG